MVMQGCRQDDLDIPDANRCAHYESSAHLLHGWLSDKRLTHAIHAPASEVELRGQLHNA